MSTLALMAAIVHKSRVFFGIPTLIDSQAMMRRTCMSGTQAMEGIFVVSTSLKQLVAILCLVALIRRDTIFI